MKIIFLLFVILFVSEMYPQTEVEAKKNFYEIKDVLASENNLEQLSEKLDALKLNFRDQKNNYIDRFLNRSIDFEYNHNRIRIQFDSWQYQIDLITKNDSIYLKSLKTEYFKKYTYQIFDKILLRDYLEKRNLFYKSDKDLKDLLKEISLDETFAMNCGEIFQYTKQGMKVNKLVKNRAFRSLKNMLSSFNCEKQSFGVIGFKQLTANGIDFPKEYDKLIEHIKTRNSEVQICSGCITGLVQKIY